MGLDLGPSGRATEDMLVMLVRESTGERSWDRDSQAAVFLRNGLLYVTQSARVHREIEELLGRLPF